MSDNVDVGPWPLGVDNVHDADDAVFQQPSKRAKRATARLQTGDNIDLRDDGWPLRRKGTVLAATGAAYRSGISAYGHLLVHADDGLYKVDTSDPPPWTSTPLVTGLSPDSPLKFQALAGQVFWLNSHATGRVQNDGTAALWGMPAPSAPLLTPMAGSLCPGTYTVACAYIDSWGVEHALSEVAVSTVGDSSCHGPGPATGFTIDVPNIDSQATSVRLYISQANGPEVYFVADAAPSDFPIAVTSGGSSPWSDVAPIGLFMHPPVPGDGLFAYRGQIITFADNTLYASLGPVHHLFEAGLATEDRPMPIRAGAGLTDGFWTVTEYGAFWTTGATPSAWDTDQKDARRYAAGSHIINGRFIPELETSEEVVLFVSNEGAVAGLPGGTLFPLTKDRYHFDVEGKTATFMNKQRGSIRQVCWTLN